MSTATDQVEPHIFLYSDPTTMRERNPDSDLLQLTVRVELDHKKIGFIGARQYVCLSLSPGAHQLRFDKAEYLIDAEEVRNYFVRIRRDSDEEAAANAEITQGLWIGDDGVAPVHFNKSITKGCPQWSREEKPREEKLSSTLKTVLGALVPID